MTKTTKAELLAELVRLTTPMNTEDNVLGLNTSYGDLGAWVYQNLDALIEVLRND